LQYRNNKLIHFLTQEVRRSEREDASGAAIPGDLSKPESMGHSHLSFRKPPCQNVALMT
jgi:hypothetical protein